MSCILINSDRKGNALSPKQVKFYGNKKTPVKSSKDIILREIKEKVSILY